MLCIALYPCPALFWSHLPACPFQNTETFYLFFFSPSDLAHAPHLVSLSFFHHTLLSLPPSRSSATAATEADTDAAARPVYPFSAIIGQEEMKFAAIMNIIDPNIGGIMVMGDRGTGKSTTVRALVSCDNNFFPPFLAVCVSTHPSSTYRLFFFCFLFFFGLISL